ncbi:MAG: MEKHLA domain-containing protein [Candidatus Marinimicrobia bacterium]|nr:MEKHLA domain-containing protein [Candidatus Neomarinimicrobiota bacterium]
MMHSKIQPDEALSHFFDQPMNLHLIARADGTILQVSRGFHTILGYDPETLEERNFLELVHPSDKARTVSEMERLSKGERTFSFKNRYRHKDGAWHLLHWSATYSDKQDAIYAVASDITEGAVAEKELAHQIAFERMVSEISSYFINVDVNKTDAVIERSLASIGSFMDMDRAYVFQFNSDGSHMTSTHEWTAPGITAHKDKLLNIQIAKEFPWLSKQIRQGPVAISDIAELPAKADSEHDHLAQHDIQSLLVVPMLSESRLIGILGFDAVKNPMDFSEGEITGLQIVAETFMRAIERSRLETERNNSEKKFRAIFQNANDAFYVHQVDSNGQPTTFTEVNQKACEMLGYSQDELLAKSPMDIDGPDLQETAESHLSDLRENGFARFEGHHISKAGKEIAVEINAILFTIDHVPHVLSIVRDMRQHKKVQAEIQESRDRLQMAMDVSEIGLWEIDLENRIQTINPGFAEMLGYGIELSTTNLKSWEELLHPDDAKKSRKKMEAHLRGETSAYQVDVRVRHGQGHWVWVRAHGKVVDRAPDGTPLRIIGTSSNITLAKEREERRERLLTQFKQMMDPLDQGMAIVNHDGQISYINAAGESMLGITEDMEGQLSVDDVFSAGNWNRIAADHESAENRVKRVEIDCGKSESPESIQRLTFVVVPHLDSEGRPEWVLTFQPVASQAESLVDIDNVENASFLTICSKCHDVKTGPDEWEQLAVYLNQAHELLISHGLCPECLYEFTQQVHQNKYHR